MKCRVFAVTVCLFLVPLIVVGQNLVMNGDFNINVDGWSVVPPADPGVAQVVHFPGLDGTNNEESGSLMLEVDLLIPGGTSTVPVLTSDQCFQPLDPPSAEMSIGYLYIGDFTEGGLIFDICRWANDDCTGLIECSGVTLDTPEMQFELAGFEGDLFGAAQAISFQIRASNNPGQAVVASAYLDKVFFIDGTTDTLPSFEVTAMSTLGGDLEVQFTGITNGGTSPFEPHYTWDFGDGSISNEQNPVYEYTSSGVYQVTLTADTGFDQSTDEIEIVVQGSPIDVPAMSASGLFFLVLTLCIAGLIAMGRQRIRS